MAHRLETAIEHLLARGPAAAADVEALLARVDAISSSFELLGQPADDGAAALAVAMPAAIDEALPPPPEPVPPAPDAAASPSVLPVAAPATASPLPIDWSRFKGGTAALPLPTADRPAAAGAAVRVRAPLLDRLVNQAGEVSITRARIESDVGQIKGSLSDLSENLERLRRQLRDLELQAESQIASRMEAAKAASQEFDPLEMDRFTRFQELTRMMAESVNDVATVQRGLQRSLQATGRTRLAGAADARPADDLLRTRMVGSSWPTGCTGSCARRPGNRQAVRLDIVGGSIEIDRGVLDHMTGPFEHLLCRAHIHQAPSGAARPAGRDRDDHHPSGPGRQRGRGRVPRHGAASTCSASASAASRWDCRPMRSPATPSWRT